MEVSDATNTYLEEKEIHKLMNNLAADILKEKPDDVEKFLREKLVSVKLRKKDGWVEEFAGDAYIYTSPEGVIQMEKPSVFDEKKAYQISEQDGWKRKWSYEKKRLFFQTPEGKTGWNMSSSPFES